MAPECHICSLPSVHPLGVFIPSLIPEHLPHPPLVPSSELILEMAGTMVEHTQGDISGVSQSTTEGQFYFVH